MLNCIAVDDEPLALDLLKDMLNKIHFLNLKGTFGSVKKAQSFLATEKIDLLFLDIQMPGINGIQFAKTLEDSKMVIFTTAFDQYAVEGFNIDAVDYILKPIDQSRLLQASEKAMQIYKWKNLPIKEDFIFIPSQHKVIKIYHDEILYVEGLKDYVKIFLVKQGKPVLTRSNLKGIEKLLPADNFMRVHKSYMVNLKKVTAREKDRIYLNTVIIPIGKNYKAELKKAQNIYK